MNHVSSIILRLFIGTILGLILFVVSVWLLLEGVAAGGASVICAVLIPMGLGLISGWLIMDLISHRRWTVKWLPLAEGTIPVHEVSWEETIKSGLRELLGPLSPLWKADRRARRYALAWARNVLMARERDEWCWKLFSLAWKDLSRDKGALERLKQLLLETDPLPESGFSLGLKLFPWIDDEDELTGHLAREGLKRSWEDFTRDQLEIMESVWIKTSLEDPELNRKILHRLTESFLAVHRRDPLAGRIYLERFGQGDPPPGLRYEMQQVARLLLQRNLSPELARELLVVTGAGDELEKIAKDNSDPTGIEVDTEFIPPQKDQALDINSIPFDEIDQDDYHYKPFRWKIRLEFFRFFLPLIRPFSELSRWIKSVLTSSLLQGKVLRRMLQTIVFLVGIIVLIIIGWNLRTGNDQEPSLPVGLSPPGLYNSDKPFTIQVAAYNRVEAAVGQMNRLRGKKVDAYLVPPGSSNSPYYQLRLGSFNTLAEANVHAESLKTAGIIEDYFVARFEPGQIPQDVSP